MPTLRERLERIEGILGQMRAREQATPGDWRIKTNRHPTTQGETWGWIEHTPFTWTRELDVCTRFAAHARTDLPALLGIAEDLCSVAATLVDQIECHEETISRGGFSIIPRICRPEAEAALARLEKHLGAA
jgi:hypothetical protein